MGDELDQEHIRTEEHITPIEAHSPGKIIELLLKIEHLVHARLATTAYVYARAAAQYVLLFLVTVQ